MNAFEGHGAGTGIEADSAGRNENSMQVLLTAAEHVAGHVPAESSSIVGQMDPNSAESRMPFNEPASGWDVSNHTNLPFNEVARQIQMPRSASRTGNNSINSLPSREVDGAPTSQWDSRLPQGQMSTWIGPLGLEESNQILRPPS